MADPRSARLKALADIQMAQEQARIDEMTARLQGVAKANAAALKGRAGVMDADAAAAEAARAAEGGDEGPPDITQFFPPSPINVTNPLAGIPNTGTLAPASALESAGPGGARGGAHAKRAVAGARQAAGTLPSGAPPQQPGRGGAPGMSVNIGGQQFSAPDTLTTERVTTGPQQFDPGFFFNATTRETITEPNALRAGDILAAQQRQVQFEEAQKTQKAQFMLDFSLRSREGAIGMANDIRRTTNAPADISLMAAGAYLAGDDEAANRLLSGYDTTGAAGINAERLRARYYDAKAREAEAAAGAMPGALYNPSVFLGLPPDPGSQSAEILASVQDDLGKVFGVGVGIGGFGVGVSDAEKASRLENIGLRLSKVGQLLVFPTTQATGLSGGSKKAAVQLPAPTVFSLLAQAKGWVDGLPAERVEAAAATAEALGLGTRMKVQVGKDEAGNPTYESRFETTVKDKKYQPWVDRVHQGLGNHSDETLGFLVDISEPSVAKLINDYQSRASE
jgi:hypothetical protein